MNRLFSDAQQWTGQRTSLEDQAIKASDQSPELLVKNLGAIAHYKEQHRKIFGTDLNPESVAKAIAAYERTIGENFHAKISSRLPVSTARGLRR